MKLSEMKRKVLALIEELNPENENLTDDPDIAAKFEDVLTSVMFELARFKKLPDYVEIKVKKGDVLRFEDITDESDYEVYQIAVVRGVEHELKANSTVIKILEDGVAEIEYYRYPTRITDKNRAKYEFELSQDALEIMPYGIAGDLLKSDISSDYGRIYSQRYEEMKQLLDPRYGTGMVRIEGGYNI